MSRTKLPGNAKLADFIGLSDLWETPPEEERPRRRAGCSRFSVCTFHDEDIATNRTDGLGKDLRFARWDTAPQNVIAPSKVPIPPDGNCTAAETTVEAIRGGQFELTIGIEAGRVRSIASLMADADWTRLKSPTQSQYGFSISWRSGAALLQAVARQRYVNSPP